MALKWSKAKRLSQTTCTSTDEQVVVKKALIVKQCF
jgi:hypothetical protein